MLFKRQKKRSILRHMREAVWPSMGWTRAFSYIKHRLIRLPDTTHSIALGLAIGTAVSFSPLVGTHFAQAMLLAYLLRANVFAGFIGTAAGNPWTFPFIWWGGFSLGSYVCGLFGWEASGNLPDEVAFFTIIEAAKAHPMDMFIPWMVGGYILCFAILLPSYYVYHGLIKSARLAREKVVKARKQLKGKIKKKK